ncbi:MAG: bifunctional diaminohydroxyphosphoribosylaminopyrimidine deaminase/5-amino-6-(5-phosphoribosylamino)uracil reductase RibD [Elusimicrobia bacterium]|nr:bifunctional diaminohydroxyphosphoribosylaminopyrimidine deaminase/5-amino-6-(5-phosphoribosylamino)uracil reductase RibD [Elusimicrobiota bacterium]
MSKLRKKFMQIALDLAKKGKGKVEPNPLVGAIVVKGNKIVGKGHHEYFGGPHAEVNALDNAGSDAKGATLYVNLEPCSKWGKTPPCTTKIINSGIRQVVCAMADVNPKNRYQGIKILKKNKVKVINHILFKKACKLNEKYCASFKNKFSIAVKTAMSLDGKIATKTGDSKWITSEKSRKIVHKLRSQSDAVLVGINTILKDNPELTSHGAGKNPIRVIIDPNLRIHENCRVLNDKKSPIILIYSNAITSIIKNKIIRLQKKAILLPFPPTGWKQGESFHLRGGNRGRIPFKWIIEKLSDISIRKILIEGGGETIANALNDGVVNKIYVFVAPKIIGGRDARTPVEGLGISKIKDALKIKNLKIRKIGTDILIEGRIK